MGVVKLSTAGILDYSKTSNFLSGNAPVSFGAFDLLETTTLTTSASSVTFSGLGAYSDYKHLQIRSVARVDVSGTTCAMRFNSDSGSNYARHYLIGSGSVSSGGQTSQDQSNTLFAAGSSQAANIFGVSVVDILDFASTNKNTTVRSLVTNSDGTIILFSGLWNDTAAITSIEIKQQTTGNFVSGSRFSIYGTKGA